MRTLYFCPVVSSFFFLFPGLISAVADWMSTILWHITCPSANLECRSEMCCTRLAEIQDAKNDAKNRHLRAIAQICRDVFSQLRHELTIGKKMLNSNISSTCLHNTANFGPLAAEIVSVVWGTPANFNGFRVLPSLLQRRRSPEVNQTLHDVWPSPGWYTMYTFSGALAPWQNFVRCKIRFAVCPSPAFAYIGSITCYELYACVQKTGSV